LADCAARRAELGSMTHVQVRETAAEPDRKTHVDVVKVAGVSLVADHDGALFWPEERILTVSDLHLEKGSAFAQRGVLLPPYDTAATLARLARAIARFAPRTVIALGDSFHDDDGPARLMDQDRAALSLLQRGRDWIWIAGNHDSKPVAGVGGISATAL